MAWRVFSTTGSFLEDFATFLAMARLMMLTNRDSGKRVTCLLSLFSLGMRSGLLERASGPARSFPGTWTRLRL